MNTNTQQNNFIGARITIARKNMRLSQVQLTEKMNLSRSMVGKWEKGISNPSTAHLIKLADVLGVSFEWLATGKEVQNLNDEVLDENMQNIKITEIINNFDKKQKHHLLNFLDLVK